MHWFIRPFRRGLELPRSVDENTELSFEFAITPYRFPEYYSSERKIVARICLLNESMDTCFVHFRVQELLKQIKSFLMQFGPLKVC